ncbi:hypothetical protein C8R46DRAFT_1361696 [Mycena filopes]|nr:hypothetical protein C8R46DRAFT_1361696 [Mycena filopes]
MFAFQYPTSPTDGSPAWDGSLASRPILLPTQYSTSPTSSTSDGSHASQPTYPFQYHHQYSMSPTTDGSPASERAFATSTSRSSFSSVRSDSSDGFSDAPWTHPMATHSLPPTIRTGTHAPSHTKTATQGRRAAKAATHNLLERQRRETFNKRITELADLLPHLRKYPRPSRSSVLTSTMAHVATEHRTRALAASYLARLSAEADMLRTEINGWRAGNRIPALAAPVRGERWAALLSGELDMEVDGEGGSEDEEDEEEGGGRRRRKEEELGADSAWYAEQLRFQERAERMQAATTA